MNIENKNKLISVCIPTYEMHGKGADFLRHSFEMLLIQTCKDFDIVVSDHSTTDVIKNVCDSYKDRLDINYYKNPENLGNPSANVNNAIRQATGKLIKIIFQDDFLYDKNSLKVIVENFDMEKDRWLVTASEHTRDGTHFFRAFYPKYNDNIHLGKNTVSSPSVLTIKNEQPLLFDERLKWLMDCDYYKNNYESYGSPVIVDTIAVVNRVGKHQVTNTLIDRSIKNKEYGYMKEKYKKIERGPINLSNVTLVAVSGIDPIGAINALQLSMKNIVYHDVLLISHNKPDNLPSGITFKQCKPTELASTNPKNKNDYSLFMAYNLSDYVESDYCLVVHNDAYVLRPEQWDKAFLKYDYIGAPWPKNLHYTNEGVNVRVGNGGFSFRSRRMLNILNKLHLPFTDNGTGFYNEDGILCNYYRKQLEDAGIRYAPVELAARFSHELDCEESVALSFGFHNSKMVLPVWLWPIKKLLRKLRIVL